MACVGRIFSMPMGVREVDESERRRLEAGAAAAMRLMQSGAHVQFTGWTRLDFHGPKREGEPFNAGHAE